MMLFNRRYALSLALTSIFSINTAWAVVDEGTVQVIDEKASAANAKADGNNSRIQALEAEDLNLHQRISTIESSYISGMGDLSVALSGSVTVSGGSTSVLGVGTQFTSELAVGDAILIAGEAHIVADILSDTSLELEAVHTTGAAGVSVYSDSNLLSIKNGAEQDKLIIDKSGNMELYGHFIREIARTTGINQIDHIDAGQIATRTLLISKLRSDTTLRIGYTDSFRVIDSSGPNACRWEIRVDGASCPGGELGFDFYEGVANNQTIRSGSVFGYCEGLSAGDHVIQVWVRSAPGYFSADCMTGWQGRWTLEAEEVF